MALHRRRAGQRASLTWLLCAISCAVVLEPSAAAASEVEPTAEDLLAIPDVQQYMADGTGGVVWVEVASGAANLFRARPPAYSAIQLTHQTSADSAPVQIAGVSSDGAQVLFFVGGMPNGAGETPNPHGAPDPQARALWLASTRDGSSRRIDGGPGYSGHVAVFSRDGSRVLYAKGSEIWSAPVATGRDAFRLFTDRGSLRELTESPNGGLLAFVSDRSKYGRGDYAWVGIFDPQTRRVTYMAPGLGIDSAPVWSPDGARIAFVRSAIEPRTWRFSDERSGPPFSVMIADARSGEGQPLWTAKPGYGARFSGFEASGLLGEHGVRDLLWAAGDQLVFPAETSGWRLLYAVPANGGDARALVSGRVEVDGASLSADRKRVCFSATSREDPHRVHLYSVSMEPVSPARPLTSGQGIERDVACAADGKTMFYRQAGPVTPERLVASREQGPELQISTGFRPDDTLTKSSVAGEAIRFKAPDGLAISAVLYRPKGHAAPGTLPAIVHAHGGSRQKVYPVWETGFGYPTVLRYLMSRGYVVLTVNYRSGTGYGLDFRDPPSYGGRGAGDVQDFVAAANWLRQNVPEVDTKKLAIYGHSYGGHIVSNVLARSNLYRVGVDSAGVGDWVAEMEEDSGGPLPLTIPQRLQAERRAYESSAISVIDRWGDEPLLLLHGDDDGSAAMRQSIELYQALERRGKTVETLILPGEQHGIQTLEHQLSYLHSIESFLERRLR